MLCNGGFNGAKEEKALLELAKRGVDGFIIASPSISDEVLKEVLQIKKASGHCVRSKNIQRTQ